MRHRIARFSSPFTPYEKRVQRDWKRPLQDRRFALLVAFNLLLIASLACSLPGLGREPATATPTRRPTEAPPTLPPATPTPPPQPLPPDLVESDPFAGSEVSLDGSITLFFNQPMDRESAEAAFFGLPGTITWIDDSTLIFTPEAPLEPATQVDLTFDTSLKAANGLPALQPINLTYQAVGYLQLTQRLPEPEASAVDPASAIVAAFNRPVVPLGGDPNALPAAFGLEPEAEGRGEWLNTSTYIFYPQPALAGGQEYTVRVSGELTGVDGSPLENPLAWSFTTQLPDLVTASPEDGASGVGLDAEIAVTFNQPMEAESVAANLALVDSNGESTAGVYTWNKDFTELQFKPDRLLKRDQRYTLVLGEGTLSGGGTPLGTEHRISFDTVPALAVTGSLPVEGGSINPYAGVEIHFSAPIKSEDVLDFITLTPEVPNLNSYIDVEMNILHLYGSFDPETDYTLIVSPNLPDAWNGRLGQEFTLNFRTQPYDPSLTVSYFTDVVFLTPAESSINAQVTNLTELSMNLGSVPQSDFQAMIAPGGYDLRQSYQPLNPRTFEQTLDIPRNQSTTVNIPLTPEGETLAPGFYFLRFNNLPENVFAGPYLLVVSNINTTYKVSSVDALVWATDLRDGSPVADLPATIYFENGSVLASGQTDAQGVLAAELTTPTESYGVSHVILGEPGQETFSAALSNWTQGLEGSNFGYRVSYDPPRLEAYLYTDRPIYRPGQTVFFRAIARQAYNGRYSLPQQASLPLKLFDDFGEEIETFDLPLSIFGTAHGSYTLPEDLAPGRYSLNYEFNSVYIQVAEYRKPEIDLSVSFPAEQALAGDSQVGTVQARYFFGAPAGNVPVTWNVFRMADRFTLPGYEVGKIDNRWLDPFPYFFFPTFGEQVATGEGETDAEGNLEIEFATEPGDTRDRYTLEVTATDESGQPVSARNSILVNPADFFIGVRPEAWVGQAGTESRFEVLVVDWDGEPAGAQPLRAEFMKVVWEEQEPVSPSPYEPVTLVPVYTPVASTDLTTGPDGLARVAFIPPEPGTYQLDVKGLGPGGERALTQVLHWVGGPGQAIWPNLPNQRLRLTADKDTYQPGDTARVFVPNPLGEGVQALVTIERGVVLRHEVMALDGDGMLPVDLGDEDAPNVYLSVTLLKTNGGQSADFRQGFLILPVEPVAQTLDVSLTSQPERTEPGGEVRFGLQVKDSAGQPVEGEFSISVVDKAVLALADPNSEEIVPAFYGEQPLSVITSMSLAASAHREMAVPLGGGGGGDGLAAPIVVREEFRDTAYWQADMVTDANGQVEVTVPLPDNLTTWEVDVRGTTTDTRVGEAKGEVLVTKDLLVRPVTPRFLVVGDHALLATVVQNNTQQDLPVEVALQATGFLLDDPSLASQPVNLPAGGRARVEWWGTAQDVESVDLIFSAVSGEFQDAARPVQGALPVLRFTAPQTFGTSGTMDTGGDRLEVVSLPRSFDPDAGQLKVELAPSLGAAMLSSLDALEHFPYQCTEQTVSRFLPNLETQRVLLEFGIDDPAMQSRLDRTLEDGLAQLLARQGEDGGWGWWQDEPSDTYVTAYVLFGLVRAQDAGVEIEAEAIQRAVDYLRTNLPAVEVLEDNWEFDRLAFIEYVLSQAGAGDLEGVADLYESRERLNPWAQALLALTLEALSPGDERTQTLYSDLESSAIRSATGAHWENSSPSWFNMSTTLQATATVLYALAQHDPASPLVADALRYLMANRGASGAWASTYETAWSLMALARVMQVTGELAGNYEFAASLNEAPLASGEASQASQLTPVTASAPVVDLYPDDPNALLIQRGGGPGRLYYTAHLSVSRPVEEVEPLERGIGITRAYYPSGEACPEGDCQPVQGARAGDLVTVRLTLTLPETAYYLMVEDYLPAGAEVLDTSLKTSQQGAVPQYDPARPLDDGWGWWYFNRPQIYDDRIAWATDSLPPGTYELTYQLTVLEPGEYRVLPARAYQFYFPEVQGTSAGEIFEIGQ